MCFVDFEKELDIVSHEDLVERLKTLGVDPADVRLMTNLYSGQRAVVRLENDKSDWTKIKKGVRQGNVLSPDLFLLYSQAVMNEVVDLEDVMVGGVNKTT